MAGLEAQAILDFWISIGSGAWFSQNDEIDNRIREKFSAIHAHAAAGDKEEWREKPESCLALIILLDQMSRNIYRGDGKAFAQDAEARAAANHAAANDFPRATNPSLSLFYYMPFMHSESILDQNRCMSLMHGIGAYGILKYVHSHREVIVRFGRFPHRNRSLGRHSTLAEREYLKPGGSGH